MKDYFKLFLSFYFHRILFNLKYKHNNNNRNCVKTLIKWNTNTFIPYDFGDVHVSEINGENEGVAIVYEKQMCSI